MVDKNTDFFKIVDNFIKTTQIPSIPIIESRLDFIPKITIAIPTYKRPDLLKEAIDSAINQIEYTDYDIMVVDNDPTRNCNTEQLVSSYKEKRLSYYKNTKNIGMVENWNRLFVLAKGEWVVMLHDDDLLFSNFLKETTKILTEKEDIGILKPFNFICKTIPTNNFINNSQSKNIHLKRIYDISFYYGNILGVPSGIIFKRKQIELLGGFNNDYYPTSDYCFFALFSKYYKIYTLNRYLSIYRIAQNESLNIKTLHAFVYNDYFLIQENLKSYKIPVFFIKNYLRHRTENQAQAMSQIWNSNFNYNMKDLGITPIPKILGLIFHIIIRSFMYYAILIKRISFFKSILHFPRGIRSIDK